VPLRAARDLAHAALIDEVEVEVDVEVDVEVEELNADLYAFCR